MTDLIINILIIVGLIFTGTAEEEPLLDEAIIPPPSIDLSKYEPEQDELVKQVIEEIIEEPERDLQWEAFVSATFRLETGNGTSSLWLNGNNPGGMRCSGDWCRYDSPEEGLDHLHRLLQQYVDEFGYDFKAIRNKYAPNQPEDYGRFMSVYYEEINKLEKEQ